MSEQIITSQQKWALRGAIFAAAAKQLGYQFQQPAAIRMHLDGSADRLSTPDVDMLSSITRAICSVMDTDYDEFYLTGESEQVGQKLGKKLHNSKRYPAFDANQRLDRGTPYAVTDSQNPANPGNPFASRNSTDLRDLSSGKPSVLDPSVQGTSAIDAPGSNARPDGQHAVMDKLSDGTIINRDQNDPNITQHPPTEFSPDVVEQRNAKENPSGLVPVVDPPADIEQLNNTSTV